MEGKKKIRVLIAKVGCDIHERGALTLMTTLRDAGMEVIYTGRYATPEGTANAAVTEGVDIIALSDHTGSLPIIAADVLAALKKFDSTDIHVIAGGLLSNNDIEVLSEMGVTGNYGTGTPMQSIIEHIREVVRL